MTTAAAQGNGDGGQAQGGEGQGQAAEGQQQAPAFDSQQVMSRLEALQTGQQELGQFLQSQPWQQQPAAEGEQQEPEQQQVDLGFLDDPSLDPAQQAQMLNDALNQQVDQRVQAALQQQLGPLQEAQDDLRWRYSAQELVGEHPELGVPEVANRTFETLRQIVAAEGLEPQVANAVMKSPQMIRMAYLAGKAMEAHQAEQQQGSGDPGAAHLEGGGGAGAAGAAMTGADWIKQVSEAGPAGRSVLG